MFWYTKALTEQSPSPLIGNIMDSLTPIPEKLLYQGNNFIGGCFTTTSQLFEKHNQLRYTYLWLGYSVTISHGFHLVIGTPGHFFGSNECTQFPPGCCPVVRRISPRTLTRHFGIHHSHSFSSVL